MNTKEKFLEQKGKYNKIIPLYDAALQGKTIQWLHHNTWEDLTEEEFSRDSGNVYHYPEVYRVKPEPKLRPWKPEEVPVGVQVKYKHKPQRYLISAEHGDGFVILGLYPDSLGKVTIGTLMKDYDYSTDGGKTWQPCGVME